MTKIHENKMTMYVGVREILNHYPEIVQALPAFKTAQADFNQQIEAILTKSKEKDALTAGKTTNKNEACSRLVNTVVSVSSSVYTHAVETGNNELKALTNLRKSHLQRARDTRIIQISEAIHETATRLIADLARYGVQPETLTDLHKQIQDYKQAFGDREQSVAHRKTARLALQELFREADTILKSRLDRLMENFKTTHPEFYGAYHAVRRIKRLAGVRRAKKEGEEKKEA